MPPSLAGTVQDQKGIIKLSKTKTPAPIAKSQGPIKNDHMKHAARDTTTAPSQGPLKGAKMQHGEHAGMLPPFKMGFGRKRT